MENKRKILAYKQPFDMWYRPTKKGDLWVIGEYNTQIYKHAALGFVLEKEIVEAFFEPIYEEIKLEDFKQVTYKKLIVDYFNSSENDINKYIKNTYPNGVIIIPDNE